nr:hypothetical protein [Tanacetum cinerariifolium]
MESKGFEKIVDFLNAHLIRRDLQLADEDGIDCLLNTTIFENLALMGCEKEDTSKQGRIDEIDADEDIALVNTHDNELQDEGIEEVEEEEVVEGRHKDWVWMSDDEIELGFVGFESFKSI